MRTWSLWLWAGLAACKARRAPAPETAPPAVAAPVPLSGELTDGVFTDVRGDFSIRVPPGWRAAVARDRDPRRVTLDREDPPVRVEVLRRPRADLALPERADCTWRFQEIGIHPVLTVNAEVLVATCAPAAPDQPRRLSWLVVQGDTQWELAALVGPQGLVAGIDAAEVVLATARWP